LNTFQAAFTPNRFVPSRVMAFITAVWIGLFLAVWVFLAPKIIPRPMEVLNAFGPLWTQGIAGDLWVSFKTNVYALVLTAFISLFFSYMTVLGAMRAPAELISKMRFLGLTGLTLIFSLVIGGGVAQKVAIVVFGMTVFTVTSLNDMVAKIPRDKFDHARTLRYGAWSTVWEVVVLGHTDQVFEVLRQNAAIGWMMLAMVEGLVRSEGGIGSVLLTQNKYFNLSAVFAIQILILVIGLLFDWFLRLSKDVVAPWSNLSVDRR
jgi:NitT/TauT family transport system permease protein